MLVLTAASLALSRGRTRYRPGDLFCGEKSIRREPDHIAGDFFARGYVVWFSFRPAQHARARALDHLPFAGPLLCHAAANNIFGRRYLGGACPNPRRCWPRWQARWSSSLTA